MPTDPNTRPTLNRVLLKLSGEAFSGEGQFGVAPEMLSNIAREIIAAMRLGTQIVVVIGGGNFIRGAKLARDGYLHRATADQMGMLGTVINGLALRDILTSMGQPARCMTAVEMPAFAEPFIRLRAIRHMEKGRVVVLAGGIGSPFFTTDTTAAQRASELECDAVLKGTKVDGIYTADPKTHPDATRYESITFGEAVSQKLGVMDLTALTMCQEQGLPVIVFDYATPGNIARAVAGEDIGTFVHP